MCAVEELVSGNELEKVLVEKSRAKVEAIREAGRSDREALVDQIDRETDRQVRALRDRYRDKTDKLRTDLDRSLPLGQRRLRDAFWDRETVRALDQVLGAFTDSDLRGFIGARLAQAAPAFGGEPVEVLAYGLGPEGLVPWVEAFFSRAKVVVCPPASEGSRGIEVRGRGGDLTFRASTELFREELLETRREELVRALFPGMAEDVG